MYKQRRACPAVIAAAFSRNPFTHLWTHSDPALSKKEKKLKGFVASEKDRQA